MIWPSSFLQDGSLLDAVLLWKKNVDQVFEGVEECPICYTVYCVYDLYVCGGLGKKFRSLRARARDQRAVGLGKASVPI